VPYADLLIVKNKDIIFEPFSKTNPRPAPPMPSPRSSKRKRKAIEIADNDSDDEETSAPHVKEEDEDDATAGSSSNQPLFSRPDLLDDEDEDEKPEGKPKLRVSYNGFSIFGKCVHNSISCV
jgi:hypothetical protein